MKFVCNRESLVRAFQIVTGVTPSRSTIPILQNARIEVSGKKISIAGTDLDVGVRLEVPAQQAKEEGVLVLPAQKILNVLRELTDDEVSVTTDGALAILKGAESEFKFNGADAAEFPEFPEFDTRRAVEIESEAFVTMTRRTTFATSRELTRYAFQGVLLELRESEVRMVASDGRRLAYAKHKMPKEKDGDAARGKKADVLKAVVPPKALDLVERILGGEDKTVSLNLEENQIRIQAGNGFIFSRLVEGAFPDYENVIPKEPGTTLTLKREAFLTGLKQVAALASDPFRAVKFTFRKGKLSLQYRAADVGEAKVDLSVGYEGPDLEVVFNSDFFEQAVQILPDESVTLEVRSKEAASVLKAGKTFTYVVMPLTVEV